MESNTTDIESQTSKEGSITDGPSQSDDTKLEISTFSAMDEEKFIFSLRAVKKKKDVFFVRKKYIKHGYRAHQCLTVGKCSQSLFMMHNETFNVWTHLVGGIYYLYQLLLLITGYGPYRELSMT